MVDIDYDYVLWKKGKNKNKVQSRNILIETAKASRLDLTLASANGASYVPYWTWYEYGTHFTLTFLRHWGSPLVYLQARVLYRQPFLLALAPRRDLGRLPYCVSLASRHGALTSLRPYNWGVKSAWRGGRGTRKKREEKRSSLCQNWDKKNFFFSFCLKQSNH